MAYLSSFFRWVILYGVAVLLPAGFAGFLWGLEGAAYVAALGFAAVVLLGVIASSFLLRAYGATSSIHAGIGKDHLEALRLAEAPRARLFVYPDPSPELAVLRSLGGKGCILLSQGFIARASESELRTTVKYLGELSQTPGLSVLSSCSLMALWVMQLAPGDWRRLFLERRPNPIEIGSTHPLTLIWFWLLLPIADLFLRLGGRSIWHVARSEPPMEISLILEKMRRFQGVGGLHSNQILLSGLRFSLPWKDGAILSLSD